jgi:hypothetical protein
VGLHACEILKRFTADFLLAQQLPARIWPERLILKKFQVQKRWEKLELLKTENRAWHSLMKKLLLVSISFAFSFCSFSASLLVIVSLRFFPLFYFSFYQFEMLFLLFFFAILSSCFSSPGLAFEVMRCLRHTEYPPQPDEDEGTAFFEQAMECVNDGQLHHAKVCREG